MAEEADQSIPLDARLIGCGFVLFGLGGVWLGLPLLVGAVRQLASSSQSWGQTFVWPGASIAVLQSSVALGLAVADVIAGWGLLARRRWSRPWIVCLSAIGVLNLIVHAVTRPEMFGWDWRRYHEAPGIASASMVAYVTGGSLLVIFALVAAAIRGWRLPPPRARDWITAILVIGTLHGYMRFESRRTENQLAQHRAGFAERDVVAREAGGKGRLRIHPTLGGKPLAIPDCPGRVTLSDLRRNKDREVEVRCVGGVVEVPDVETGQYVITVNLDANSNNAWEMPGDYVAVPRGGDDFSGAGSGHAPGRFEVEISRSAEVIDRELPFERVMGLLRPDELAREMPDSSSPILVSPITLTWEPIGEGAVYHCGIVLLDRNGAREVATTDTSDPGWTIALPATMPGQRYRVNVSARVGSRLVGSLSGVVARRYDFEVRS